MASVVPEAWVSDSTASAATAIAKATGTAFGDDSIGAIMKKYDKDGNGMFDVHEVRNIVQDIQHERQKSKQQKQEQQ